MSPADKILNKLLVRAEKARLSQSTRTIRESLKSTDNAFWKLGYDARNALYERMRSAEKVGCIKLEWSRLGGDDRPLEGIIVTDLIELAKFLGQQTNTDVVEIAKTILTPWLEINRVGELFQLWQNLKSIRGLGPESAIDFADALKVLDIVRAETNEDKIVRQLSTRLFGNSKRIEELTRYLDILTADSTASTPRHSQEVFEEMGITKEPQPFLVAGTGTLMLTADQVCPVLQPFVGVSNRDVLGYQGNPTWLLTIENLTTFHQAARLLVGRTDGLVLYTGGMPSPAWRSAYSTILLNLPDNTKIYHWGDFDEGGFRIARVLHATIAHTGRILRPWLMDIKSNQNFGISATSSIAGNMARYARDCGWQEIYEEINNSIKPFTSEQEAQNVLIPFA